MQSICTEALPQTIELSHGDWRVLVCAELGGSIVGAWWRGMPVLREGGEQALAQRNVRRMGCYPLVPYSNRIGYGRFDWHGETHHLRPNFPGEPHALHGFGWQRAWRVAQSAHDQVVLSLEHDADLDWPYACTVEQRIAIDANRLSLALAITNRAACDVPAGLGWHPYFPLTPATRLQTGWRHMLSLGTDKLPDGVRPVPASLRFDRPRALGEVLVDDCFTDWCGEAMISERASRLHVQAQDLPAAVLFRPPGASFFAFEPVTHSNNALNFRAVPGTVPMRTVAPGATLRATMTMTMTLESR